MVQFSILELGRVRQNGTRKQALDGALDLAQQAEKWGFQRIWVAEHHNMPTVTTAATAIVISHLASGTKSIRVGAGGIMLPNHAPLVIAEQFGTLETLFPGRIDLGLGRAPGTDAMTIRALRRAPSDSENFPQDVLELQNFLSPLQDGQRVEAVPGSGTNVPLWILGSSLFGAQLAAELGLPFGFASHFAPGHLLEAIELYRHRFKPSATLQKPYVLVGLNVIAASSDEEAKYLATSQQMSFCGMVRGKRELFQPPIPDIERYWTPREKEMAMSMLSRSILGAKETVKSNIRAFLQETQADEIMFVSDIYDHQKRLDSFKIISEVMKEI